MVRQTATEQDGVVLKALSNTMLKVQLQNGHIITAHISDKVRMYFIRVLPGDKVKVEMSPCDFTRDRISYKYRQSSHSGNRNKSIL